jgi:hypothetical protein
MPYLNKIWDCTAHPFVTRDTPTEFEHPPGPKPQTVLEAAAFMLRYDEYWWNLSQLCIPPIPLRIYSQYALPSGQYALPSGLVTSSVPAKEANARMQKERELYREAYAARENKKKKQGDLEKLQVKTAKDHSKLKEMEKKVREISKKITKDERSFAQFAQGAKEATEMRSGM